MHNVSSYVFLKDNWAFYPLGAFGSLMSIPDPMDQNYPCRLQYTSHTGILELMG